jgi:hypothetical protein
MRHLVKDDEFLRSVTKQMQGNSKDDNDLLSKEVQRLRKNEAQITKRLGNLVEQLSANAKLKESETITNAVIELEKQRFELRNLIRQKEKAMERVKIGNADVLVLKQMLSEYVELYHSYTPEQKRRINHLIFGGIVSNFKRNEVTGDLEILIRGDGTIRKTWE